MGELLDQQTAVKAVEQKLAALDAEEQTFSESVEAVTGPYVAARVEWEADRDRALREGRPVPEAPTPPDLGDTAAKHQQYALERQVMQQERKAALAAARPDVERQAAQRDQGRSAQVRELAEQLVPLVDDTLDDLHDLAQVRGATGARNAVAPKDVDAALLVRAVVDGSSVIAVDEPTVQASVVVPGDVPAAAMRRVGGPGAEAGMTTNLPEQPEFYGQRVQRGGGRYI